MCPSSPEELAQPEAREAARRPVFIMGSRGKMGLMLSERLRGAGYEVEGFDAGEKPEDASLAEAIRPRIHDDSVIVMCVPVGKLREALASVTSLLGPENLLMDITSVKSLPMQWMEEAFNGMVVGSHPLFGPNPNPVDMRVALVRGEKAHDAA